MRRYCPTDTGFEIQALAVWGRYLFATEASTILYLYEWAGKKNCVSFKRWGQSGARTHDIRLSKQAALTTAVGSHQYHYYNITLYYIIFHYIFIIKLHFYNK